MEIWTIALWVPNFSGLGNATISALLQILGILSWRMQEVRKSQNQDSRFDPAWSMNSGKIESKPGDFPCSWCLRALASSFDVKGPGIRFPSGIGTFHKSDSCLLMSLVDSRFPDTIKCSHFLFELERDFATGSALLNT